MFVKWDMTYSYPIVCKLNKRREAYLFECGVFSPFLYFVYSTFILPFMPLYLPLYRAFLSLQNLDGK